MEGRTPSRMCTRCVSEGQPSCHCCCLTLTAAGMGDYRPLVHAFLAFSARLPATSLVHPSVFGCERVAPSLTVRLGCLLRHDGIGAPHVLPNRHRFKVRGVATQFVSAQVVEYQTIRHRSDESEVRRSVGMEASLMLVLANPSVAVFSHGPTPMPTFVVGATNQRKPLQKRRLHRCNLT